MIDYPFRCTLLISVLILSSCGGGSGGSNTNQQSSSPFVTIPIDPATTERDPGSSSNNRPSTNNPGTDSSRGSSSNQTDPENNSGPGSSTSSSSGEADPDITDSSENGSLAEDTVENFGPISDLFGRAIFAHRFDDNETLFIIDALFGPDNTTLEGTLGFRATTDAQFAFRAEGEEQFTNSGMQSFSCFYFDEFSFYYCTSRLNSGASVNFVFDRVVDGEAIGDFEFCDADLDVGQCNSNLLERPRGSVLVLVDSSVTASSVISPDAARLATDQELLSYLQYGHQVSDLPAPTNRAGNRNNPNKQAMLRAMSSLQTSMAR